MNQFENPIDLKELSVKEMNKISDEIASFLASKSRFDIETIIKNLNVLETTVALHHVYDFQRDHLIFDGGTQVLVHKILTGRASELELRTNTPIYLDPTNPYDAYKGGDIGEGLGVALGYALNDNGRTVIMMDDNALNYGLTYETLMQIGRLQPDLTIILIDEQQSLLRHYSSVDSLVKSIRISKTYTGLKKDMKAILDSNAFSRPLLTTLTKIRDAVKETVLEPTIFTQFGINYHGPINGQNMNELIKVFELSTKFSGPNIIHVQTRLKHRSERKLEFPAFKTDMTRPENYTTTQEAFDELLSAEAKVRENLFVLADTISIQDHFIDFALQNTQSYLSTSGSTQSLVTIAAGMVESGKQVVLMMKSYRFLESYPQLVNQFVLNKLPITILISDSGLSPQGEYYKQGIMNPNYFDNINMYTGSSIGENYQLLQLLLNEPGINVLNYSSGYEKLVVETAPDNLLEGYFALPLNDDSNGVVITFGNSVQQFKSRISNNELNIALYNAIDMNHVDDVVIEALIKLNKLVVVYNTESTNNALYHNIQEYCAATHQFLNLKLIDLSNVDLNASSKDIKTRNHLHVDDALKLFTLN